MIIQLNNPKRGDKVTITRELKFGKGPYTETLKICAVWDGKIMLEDGEIVKYYSKN